MRNILIALAFGIALSACNYAEAKANQNQVFSCQLDDNQEITMSLDDGFISYHYENALDQGRNTYYPDVENRDLVSVYQGTVGGLPGTAMDTIRVSFHLPEAATSTILSMEFQGKEVMPSIVIVYKGKVVENLPCLRHSNESVILRKALAAGISNPNFKMDSTDPLGDAFRS